MKQKILSGIIYVSIWILIWGTIGSLIDYPLLKSEVYEPGSIGQYITFLITAFIVIIASIKLFKINTNNQENI